VGTQKGLLVLAPVFVITTVSARNWQRTSEPDWDSLDGWTKGVPSIQPNNGFVPDDTTAIRIAEAVWDPIYGTPQISGERPFYAHLSRCVWTVAGTTHAPNGGAALIKLSQ
jgi:hypothetical protein